MKITQAHLDALKAERQKQKQLCIDPYKPSSRPSEQQDTVLKEVTKQLVYLVAGNQFGKSQIGARILSWKFQDNHPYWRRPNKKQCFSKECNSHNIQCIDHDMDEYICNDCERTWIDWGDEPLTLLVAGRVMKQIEELWEKKVQPFLGKEGVDYKIRKDGGALSSVVNLKNGNKIIFFTHDKAEQSREKVQSFVAHHVWLDEMPSSHKYIEEFQRRVDARRGQFIATFTPKAPNPVIRQMAENVDPLVGIKFKFGKLDNPIYRNRKEQEIAKLAGLPEAERNCILYGDWMDSSDAVFQFPETSIQPLPEDYSKLGWPHLFSIDPAAGGKTGYCIIGIRPLDKMPFVVEAGYMKVEGNTARYMSNIIRKTTEYHVVRKVFDPAERWFSNYLTENREYGWMEAYKQDKTQLIIGLQKQLESGKLLIFNELTELISELKDAEWDDNPSKFGKIKNSTKYHICDALQYAINHMPKIEDSYEAMTPHARMVMKSTAQREAKRATAKGQHKRAKLLMKRSRNIW